MEILFVFRHGFKEFYDHRKCDRSGYDIRDGLGYLNSGESKDSVHDTEDVNENESASEHGQEGTTAILSNALQEHVSIKAEMLITTKLLFTLNQKALRTRLYFPAP